MVVALVGVRIVLSFMGIVRTGMGMFYFLNVIIHNENAGTVEKCWKICSWR